MMTLRGLSVLFLKVFEKRKQLPEAYEVCGFSIFAGSSDDCKSIRSNEPTESTFSTFSTFSAHFSTISSHFLTFSRIFPPFPLFPHFHMKKWTPWVRCSVWTKVFRSTRKSEALRASSRSASRACARRWDGRGYSQLT